jgi:hypothetical protein
VLVDLAGSERNYETVHMSAAQHRESALINKSLMALKDCFRALHHNQQPASANATAARVPFRASKLTQLLRAAFTDEAHRTTLVTCVSPAPADIWHSINSLRHTVLMSPPLLEFSRSVETTVQLHDEADDDWSPQEMPVIQWSTEHVMRWIACAEGGRFAHVVLPPDVTGRRLLGLNAQRLSSLFALDEEGARGEGEGPQWTIAAATGVSDHARTSKIGRALFNALRRTHK